MVNTCRSVPFMDTTRHLADYMTKLKNFTKGEIHEFSAFPFSVQ